MMNIILGEISEMCGLCAQRHSIKTVEDIVRFCGIWAHWWRGSSSINLISWIITDKNTSIFVLHKLSQSTALYSSYNQLGAVIFGTKLLP